MNLASIYTLCDPTQSIKHKSMLFLPIQTIFRDLKIQPSFKIKKLSFCVLLRLMHFSSSTGTSMARSMYIASWVESTDHTVTIQLRPTHLYTITSTCQPELSIITVEYSANFVPYRLIFHGSTVVLLFLVFKVS